MTADADLLGPEEVGALREETGSLLHEAVDGAGSAGHGWDAIGHQLGVSRWAAQQRFGATAPSWPSGVVATSSRTRGGSWSGRCGSPGRTARVGSTRPRCPGEGRCCDDRWVRRADRARQRLEELVSEGPSTTPTAPVGEVPQGAVVLDVREDDEWEAGHAPGALHVPLGDLPARLAELPAGEELYVVCRAGGRAARAAAWLGHNGYDAVVVDGGMGAWVEAGRPLEATGDGVPRVI